MLIKPLDCTTIDVQQLKSVAHGRILFQDQDAERQVVIVDEATWGQDVRDFVLFWI